MIMRLHHMLDQTLLIEMLNGGYVREQVHPSEPLAILNYTEKAAYENVWNQVTLNCRGLIYRTDTGEVVARGFPKFFNYGQVGAPELQLDTPVIVTDKLDGSLGIMYPKPSGGFAIATRGSFASEQAIHATRLLHDRYDDVVVPSGVTALFEIIYPENRIVVDYSGLDELILLGIVNVVTGAVYGTECASWWPAIRAVTLTPKTFAEALALTPRPGAEGIVVRCLTSGNMVKIKQEDYVALHRIVTGLNARTVWEHLMSGKPLGDLLEPLPDEFHDWVRDVVAGIANWMMSELSRLTEEFYGIVRVMPEGWNPRISSGRKAFAQIAVKHPDKWAMFGLIDGKDIRPELIKRAKPEAFVTPHGQMDTEDKG